MSAAGSPAHAGKPAKTMSSRLMTMKFMQRAVASSPSSNMPSLSFVKRPRLSNGPTRSTTVFSDESAQTMRTTLAAEEAMRAGTLEWQAADAGEAKWVLSIREERPKQEAALCILSAAYAEAGNGEAENSEMEEEPWKPRTIGRRSFGKFNSALEHQNGRADSSSCGNEAAEDAREEGSDDESNDRPGAGVMIRASRSTATQRLKDERRAERRAQKVEMTRVAEKRMSRVVKLNLLTSISKGAGGGGGADGGNITRVCFTCGEAGHVKKDCLRSERKKARLSLD